MDIEQTNQALTRIFQEEKKRIVFWYDGEKEFEELLPLIEVEGVSLIRIDETSALALKIRLETQDVQEKFILYAPTYEPPPERDWLCDIKLYSYLFHADKASILMKELGLSNMSMRPYIKERNAFFRSQDRLDRLKKWVEPDDREDDIDLKMLTALTRAAQPEPFAILMKLMDSFCRDDQFNPTMESKSWKEIETLGLAPSFWKMVTRTFGYVNESSPALMDLLIKVFVTDFANSFRNDLPVSLEHFRITGGARVMNASVFLNQWQTHTIHCKNFNHISGFIAERLNITDILPTLNIEELLNVMTFEKVEQRIISSLRDQIVNTFHKDFSEPLEMIKKRVDGYWTNRILDEPLAKNLYRSAYQALETSINLFDLRKKYNSGFHYKTAVELFTAYTEELSLFDQYYRQFIEIANQTEQAGWDVLKPLRHSMDECYSGWFMEQLSMSWGEFLEPESDTHKMHHNVNIMHHDNGEMRSWNNSPSPFMERGLGGEVASTALLETWKLPGILNQYNFFKQRVKPVLTGSDRSRIFVIISDAFRYEAAKELTTTINGKYRLQAWIEPMLGTLPGYTSLGMASLLPYNSLTFSDDSSLPRIDGKPVASLEQRAAILKENEGTAIKSKELSAMSKDNGREFVKPHRVIYIYHDEIDRTGDKAVSEEKTFEAVRTTIDELTALVGFIINSLNGTRIMITSDHGFIYQEKELDQLDKSTLDMPPDNAVKKHKRFILGKELHNDYCEHHDNISNRTKPDNLFSGSTRVTSNTDTDMHFWLPKGTNRFHFVGGARFFHGGAMLQEIVIPVVTVSEMKGIHREKSEIKRVGISILGSTRKIVTNIPRFEFIQTDAVSARMTQRVLKISLRDGNDLISNEETITFDSSSSSMEDRKKSVKLPLKSGPFDNKKEYALVLRNAEDETEYDRFPLRIDIAFANDF